MTPSGYWKPHLETRVTCWKITSEYEINQGLIDRRTVRVRGVLMFHKGSGSGERTWDKAVSSGAEIPIVILLSARRTARDTISFCFPA
jgi:hypothetical protein